MNRFIYSMYGERIEEQLEKEIEAARKAGVVGPFTLATNILPEIFFIGAPLGNKVVYYTPEGEVTIIKKKHKCPTCGVEK